MDFSYNAKNKSKSIEVLGIKLQYIFEVVPKGKIIIFKGFELLNLCYDK